MIEAPARILVVDDDEGHLELIAEILRRARYTTVPARDGMDALDKFEKYQPDLVVLDLMMPRLNGLEVSSRIRHHPQRQDVPILMMTGLDEAELKSRALDAGINDFLYKPVEARELQMRVRALLKLQLCDACHSRQETALARARQGLTDLERQLAQLTDQPGLGEARAACLRLAQEL